MDIRTPGPRWRALRDFARRHRYALSYGALALALALQLGYGIRDDWRHLHDDDGMHYSVIAQSHLMGLRETGFHNAYRDPLSGEIVGRYLHHPPLLGLAIALAFRVTGITAYWMPRLVSIAFHLTVLGCTLWLAWRLLERRGPRRRRDSRRRLKALLLVLGGFALVPVSTYFGKAVVYPPITMAFALGGMVLHHAALERLRLRRPRWWLPALAGVPVWVLAAFSGWFSHFLLASATLLALAAALRTEGALRRRALALAAGCMLTSALGLAAVALHMYLAGGLEAFGDFFTVYRSRSGLDELEVMGRDYTVYAAKAVTLSLLRFLALVPAALAVVWLVRAGRAAARGALTAADAWIFALLLPGLLYILAASRGATQHPFYVYFIMPAVLLASAKVILETADAVRLFPERKLRWVHAGAAAALAVALLTAASVLKAEYSVDDPFALDRVATLQIRYTAPAGQRMFPPRVIRPRLPSFEPAPPSLIPASWGLGLEGGAKGTPVAARGGE